MHGDSCRLVDHQQGVVFIEHGQLCLQRGAVHDLLLVLDPATTSSGKSGDEANALIRHLMEADYVGMAWRALALLQKHCEANGSPIAPGARNTSLPGLDAAQDISQRAGHPKSG